MAILKDELLKDNLINFIGDIPAYAFIAYVNFLQVVPSDYPAWEGFLLKHGWLILLLMRLLIAFYDLVIRVNGNYWIVDDNGKPRRKSLWTILKNEILSWIK
ncbi:hypothetical protein EB118_20810 [bacterium]|nr:hypothetical protein [bacterium]NDD85293.1 hypothetical protein [bacterium]NDG32501.1 hypothetical protein [bacterium]